MSSHPHPHGELVNEDVHHQEDEINVRSIVTFVIVLTVITLAIQGIVYGFFLLFNKIEDKTQPQVSPLTPAAAQVSDFPAPSLQTSPWADLKKLRADENTYLHSYGWVDQGAGIARIPIDRAKELLLRQGLPVRADAVTDPTEGTHVAATGESSGGRNLVAGGADKSASPAGASSAPAAAPKPAVPGAAAPKSPEATKAGGGL
jgi:hypothetical protein